MNSTHLFRGAAAVAIALATVTPSFAQETIAADCVDDDGNGVCDSEETGAQIIVTGSRIARPNLDASAPITSVTAENLLSNGDQSLGDSLNQLPALRSTFSQANSTGSIGTSGLNLLDLRGLGTGRTLTLINGRRAVSATPGTYRVDTNTISNVLLERVDVVTGGTSAVYGSDAVAGVVNFIMKRDYDGIELRGQGGISDRGDRGSYQASIVAGRNFADGRGNIAASLEYNRNNTLLFNQRNDQFGAFTGTPGFFTSEDTLGELPAGDGIPDTSYFDTSPGSKFNIISLGGMVNVACPAATPTNAARRAAVCTGQLSNTGGRLSNNYAFLEDGTLVRSVPDLDFRPVGGGTYGGLGASGVEGAMALPGIKRLNGNLLAHFELSPGFVPYFEGSFSRVRANQTSTQPTFVNGSLSPVFYQDNPFLSAQALDTIRLITGNAPVITPGSPTGIGAFTFFRFNNDIGTRAENHKRDTYRAVVGLRGEAENLEGSWSYDIAFNYGRTETFYKTGGNVLVSNFNKATDAVRDTAGNIVCRVNIDANPANDDPNCRPINLFGFGAPSTTPEGLKYVMHTSSRDQWAEMFNIIASMSGDSTQWFELPGGPISFALGIEHRREDAYSAYDPVTVSGATFLNSFADFSPPQIRLTEAFGEVRIPLLADRPFFNELTIEAAGRVAKYSNVAKPVYAYNAGAIWSPIDSLRLRVSYAKSVRTPNLSDAYATRSQTFANNFVDPCSQTVINQDPNRARNCAAAGIPTTITLPDGSTQPWVNNPTSGLSGFNQGNENLSPETGKNLTVGTVFEPTFLPGLSLSVDYYKIKIEKVIASLTGQALINRCYDDPVGINNVYCAALTRRYSSTDPILNGTFAGQQGRRFAGFPDFNLGTTGPSFINQPFNYAAYKTSGVDAELNYRHTFENGDRLVLRSALSWVENREYFTSVSDPTFSDRVHGELGDPRWEGSFGLNFRHGPIDIDYDFRYIGKQSIGVWEAQHSWQGRPPTNADQFPFKYYPEVGYIDLQVGYNVGDEFRFYVGADNVFDRLPPYGLTGTGDASAIFPLMGRYLYAGARVRF